MANSQSQIDILQSELGRLNTNALAIQKMFDVEVADALKQQQDEEMHLETKQNNIRLEDALQEMTKNAANLEQQLRSEQVMLYLIVRPVAPYSIKNMFFPRSLVKIQYLWGASVTER